MTRQPCFDREYLEARIAEGSEVVIPGVGIFGKGNNDLPPQEELDRLAYPKGVPTALLLATAVAAVAAAVIAPQTPSVDSTTLATGEGAEGAKGQSDPAADPLTTPVVPPVVTSITPPAVDPPVKPVDPLTVEYAKRPLSAYVGMTPEQIREQSGVGDATRDKIVAALAALPAK